MNMIEREFRRCLRCVMDTSAENIKFDSDGICNFCSDFFLSQGDLTGPSYQQGGDLDHMVEEIKREGRDKPYDCVIGVSGGVDSSYVLVQAVQRGLRPLAVHMDNGWNSELAQNNIANLIKSLKVDLHTHVIDWDEYRELMLAFLEADVVDVELLYDNAMLGVNYRYAAKYGLKTIVAGSNKATEGIKIPDGWNWHKLDLRNIRDLADRRGVKLRTFPGIGSYRYAWYREIRKIRWLSLLDYMDYNKESALRLLEDNYGFKRYPYKHYESVFTRFYQAVILPRKYGIDKRLLHFSSLIVSGQMTRDDALLMLEQGTYPTKQEEDEDLAYFLKKVGWDQDRFFDYLARERRGHDDYRTEINVWNRLMRLKNIRQTLITG